MGDVQVAYCLRSILSALGKSVIKSLKNLEPLLRGVVVCFFDPCATVFWAGEYWTIPYQVSRSFGQRQSEVESRQHRQDFPPVLLKF